MLSPRLSKSLTNLPFQIPYVLVAIAASAGCTHHRDVQYFAALDGSGNTNYYRVTIEGSSFGTEYHLQSGNFSAASVDVIRGKMPDIPELDLPIQHERVLDEAINLYHQRVLTDGYDLIPYPAERAKWIATAQSLDNVRREVLTIDSELKHIDAMGKDLDSLKGLIKEKTDLLAAANSKFSTIRDGLKPMEAADSTARAKLKELEKQTPSASPENLKAAQEASRDASDKLVAKIKELADQDREVNRLQGEIADAESKSRTLEFDLRRAKENEPFLKARLPALYARISQHRQELAVLSMKTISTTQPTTPEEAAKITEAEIDPPAFPQGATTRPAEPTEPGELNRYVKQARIAWYASLSTSDVVGMGQEQSDDPYVFRKHCVYVSAKNVNLQEISAEIDSAIGSILSIARSSKQQAAQRRAQREAKRTAFTQMIGTGKATPEDLAKLMFPPEDSPTLDFIKQLQDLWAGISNRSQTEASK